MSLRPSVSSQPSLSSEPTYYGKSGKGYGYGRRLYESAKSSKGTPITAKSSKAFLFLPQRERRQLVRLDVTGSTKSSKVTSTTAKSTKASLPSPTGFAKSSKATSSTNDRTSAKSGKAILTTAKSMKGSSLHVLTVFDNKLTIEE